MAYLLTLMVIRPHYNVSHPDHESPSLVSEQEMIRMRNFVI